MSTEFRSTTDGATSSFTVGEISCRIVSDGHFAYPPDFLFANVDPTELDAALSVRLDEDGNVSTPYRCLVLQTPRATVLVDTGLGRAAAVLGAPAGHLLTALATAGLFPDDIDVVVISHAHPDHIGGLLFNGELTFPAARHVMSRIEWEFWTSDDTLAELPEMLAAPARALLPPLAKSDVLDLADGETDIVNGIRLIPAPGHTPGHCVVEVASASSSLTFLADAVIDELQFRNPSWVSAVDVSAEQTVHTRARLLDQAAADGSVVLAYHMAGAGHVERSSGAYRLHQI